jgi:hypothetical protein
MAQSARYLTFEGQFESSVLGTFRIIRGFRSVGAGPNKQMEMTGESGKHYS